MSFLNLPNEILLLVAENLTESPRDYFHFLSTSRHLYHLTISRFQRLAHEPKDGQPALHWAIKRTHLPLLSLLLSQGVDPNIRDTACNTALHAAIKSMAKAQSIIITTLLKHGASINLQNAAGESPLTTAITLRKYSLVSFLLDKAEADVNIPDNDGSTPLHRLVDTSSNTHVMGDHTAEGTVKLLLKKGAYIDKQDCSNMSPLYLAIAQGHTSLIQTLLSHGANLFLHQEMGVIAIRRAVSRNDTELIELFLRQKGANVNYQDVTGKTVLHYAASLTISGVPWNLDNAIKLLVDMGADVRLRDNSGATPLKLVRNPSEWLKRLLDPDLEGSK